ncbi:MAG: NACHT domain-containing NTPase [Cyanobacteria bacterium J06635_10]
MVKRSLKASKSGIKTAETVLTDMGLTQQLLADALGITRQPVSKFFNGKPVSRDYFVRICKKLNEKWQDIAVIDEEIPVGKNKSCEIDDLVQEIHKQLKPGIKKRCGFMRVLDMEQPIELTGERGIYTQVNILEKINARKRLEISQLLESSSEFERLALNPVIEKSVSGIEAVKRYKQLMVWGKPGAGKTTFLKYLAMQCIGGNLLADSLPIFISLKDFAEADEKPDLLTYISQITNISINQLTAIQNIISQGRALILLDGLDEVREGDTKRVIRQIRDLSDKFDNNQFVITCRIAAKEYTFESFTEVEVADFDEKQIAIFAQNWFRAKNDLVKAQKFLEKLEKNKSIFELATNPLLLTLLCLVFGESFDFPANRSELYKEGLDVLLKKWDAKRNIQRDDVYKNLSLQRKVDLLSQIALITFENKDYFFKQKVVEAYIADYIYNLPNARTKAEELEIDSEAVLKSIESQHGFLVERAKGIYSFSHLTFQEYFTAREIVETQNNDSLQRLIEKIIEKRWREVFLLTAGMLRNADELLLLMKRKIDGLVSEDEKLQQLLSWAEEKSRSVETPYKYAAVRAFYSYFASINNSCIQELIHPNRSILAYIIDPKLRSDIADSYVSPNDIVAIRGLPSLFSNFALVFTLPNDIGIDIALALVFDNDLAFMYALNSFVLVFELELDIHLQNELLLVKNQLPSHFNHWCKEDWQAWLTNLHNIMLKHRNIGYDWQFTKTQKQLLRQYFDANKLLVDCLNSDSYISRQVRHEIEDTLLLPMS